MSTKQTENKKILVLNGSPQCNESCTMRVTNAFVKGLFSVSPFDIEVLNLSQMNILSCRGCLSCWGRTEGNCVIKGDDVEYIKQKILDSDIIIESFPLFFFGMPGTIKNMTDRLLSMVMAYKGEEPIDGLPYHDFRYDMSGKKLILISSCGYNQIEKVYDALLIQYNCIFGKDNYLALLFPQGRTLASPTLFDRTEEYLERYVKAGEEFATNGIISEETKKMLKTPPFTDRQFKVLINKFWHDEKAK